MLRDSTQIKKSGCGTMSKKKEFLYKILGNLLWGELK